MKSAQATVPASKANSLPTEAVITQLVKQHGEAAKKRAETGVKQVALRWRSDDGTAEDFTTFCTTNFVAAEADVTRLLDRLEKMLTSVGGHLYEIRRDLRWWSDVKTDTFAGVDDALAKFDPAPDLSDQFYRQKVAFIALLNFDRGTLAEMLAKGATWSTTRWAEARLAQAFGPRIPMDLADRARKVTHEANQFVSGFHIPVGRMVDQQGKRWFEPDRKLLAHWLVREEVKAGYGDPDGLAKQRALMRVMGRHIDGTIPKAVMECKGSDDWNPDTNKIGGGECGETLGAVRYQFWNSQRDLAAQFDPLYPEAPTAIARKFDLAREIPEAEVERLLISLLEHPVREQIAAWLRKRLGRALEPHDVYFEDIAESRPPEEMNAVVAKHFPDEKEFERKLPEILQSLGFSKDDSHFLGSRIRVEIARGSGHAMRPGMPEYGAWLRTSRLDREFGWDGFDTAMHELGHNLEQLCSTHFAPRPLLRNVPNTACTEAFAFLYQSLGRRVLGLEKPEEVKRSFDLDSVGTMLAACQIAGPSLLELYTWRWIYANPTASAEQLRDQVIAIADQLWSRFYEPLHGKDRNRLLAAYQHMVAHPLYLADYTIGHVMSHQIRSFMRGKELAGETKRITSLGRLTPDLWMRKAVGAPLSIEPLANDCAAALNRI
ncbi:MAG: hypothetical protein K8R92_01190 [Planctomycetes bacterium]|nr:hypothetical protein [Planctomycetota bacterium]